MSEWEGEGGNKLAKRHCHSWKVKFSQVILRLIFIIIILSGTEIQSFFAENFFLFPSDIRKSWTEYRIFSRKEWKQNKTKKNNTKYDYV